MFVNQHIVVFLWLWLLNLFIISVLTADTNGKELYGIYVSIHAILLKSVDSNRILNVIKY